MKAKVYRPELITNFTPVLRPKPAPPLDDLRLFDVLCLTFPAPLMPYLLGVMDIYRWQDRIDGTPEQKAAFTELWNHYQALFAEADVCEDDMPYRLRQSPANPCVLEQSLDGGATWSTAFDYGLCLTPALRPLIVQAQSQALATAQASLTNMMQTYTSSGGGGQPTIDQVAPEFVAKGQAVKDLALCEACRVVVDLICELELERRAQTVWGAQAFAAVVFAVGAGFLTAATVGLAAAPMMIAGAALLGVMVDVGIGAIGTISDALLNDTEARQEVACCMYSALKGQSPTLANFSASLGGCAFPGGSNESQLAGAIAPLLNDTQVHASFLNNLNELARWAELGLISCECVDETIQWDIVWDFRDGWNGFNPVNGGDGLPQGNYIAGEGIGLGPSKFAGVTTLNIGREWGNALTITQILVEIETNSPQNDVTIYLHTQEPSYEIAGAYLPTPIIDGLRTVVWAGDVSRLSTSRFAIGILPESTFNARLRRILVKTS